MPETKTVRKNKTGAEKLKIPKIQISVKFKNKPETPLVINTATRVYQLSKHLFSPATIEWTESFFMVCLNAANHAIGYYQISSGGMAHSVVDVKVVFTIALSTAAHSLVFIHNHPSGVLSPSREDISITNSLIAAGKLLEMKVLDHLIVSPTGFYSMAENGFI